MDDFKLVPVDVLVSVNDRKDPFSILKRGLMGNPYDHVYAYMGQVGLLVCSEIIKIPMLCESDGDGFVIESLASRYGESVVVMRLKSQYRGEISRILQEAVLLAQDPQSKYDYMCIIKWVLPRLICEKLHLPMPLKYQRNPAMICSEACAEVFWRAELVDIVSKGIVPLPSSFVESSLLNKVWEGELNSDLV